MPENATPDTRMKPAPDTLRPRLRVRCPGFPTDPFSYSGAEKRGLEESARPVFILFEQRMFAAVVLFRNASFLTTKRFCNITLNWLAHRSQ